MAIKSKIATKIEEAIKILKTYTIKKIAIDKNEDNVISLVVDENIHTLLPAIINGFSIRRKK